MSARAPNDAFSTDSFSGEPDRTFLPEAEPEGWLERSWSLLQGRLRPDRGWLALIASLLLASLPVEPLRSARFVRTDASTTLLTACALLGVLFTWLLVGWGRNRIPPRHHALQIAVLGLALVWLGVVTISLFVVEWVPPLGMLWRSLRAWNGYEILIHLQVALDTLTARIALWQLGGAAPGGDELIVASFLAAAIWLTAVATATLCRWGRTGIVVALPTLTFTALVVFASGNGQWIFLGGLALALLLSLTLDNGRLLERWQIGRMDFSPDLLLDRWFNAFAIAAVALALAAGIASISLASISDFFARMLTPVTESIESASEQTFPGVDFTNRSDRPGDEQGQSARVTGLPNEFLLGAGPEPSNERILEVRTSDLPTGEDPPPAPYLFSRAYNDYVGTGWTPEPYDARETLVPNDRRTAAGIVGRRLLAQSIARLKPIDPAPFAADLAETGVQSVLDLDPARQVVRMNTAARNYTLLSSLPAMSDAEFAALPEWGTSQSPLPAGFEIYLALPESVTQRTRDLAAELTEGIDSPYLRAQAIERHLRGFTYDLSIQAPPPDVTDVADYFLFELQRGYCDYFATAFVVLARAAGLPARFVAGYAPGVWNPESRSYIVTAARSHAWPEVYLPRVGWVAFEPTSSLPALARISATRSYLAPETPPLPESPPAPPAFVWNWQMVFWLVPVALVLWLVWSAVDQIRRRREDPWESLARWGARRGRPLEEWETPSEYAAAIAALAASLGARKVETANTVQRESLALGDAVARLRYAPDAEKQSAQTEVRTHWKRMRDLLPHLR